MSRRRGDRLEDQILTALRGALSTGRLNAADHLLRALEALAPGSAPRSPLAETYLAIRQPPSRAGRPAPVLGAPGP